MPDREHVTLAGVRMSRAGFVAPYDLSPLLGGGPMRGEDLHIETVNGTVPKGRRQDAWPMLLQFLLRGQVDHDGHPHPDVRVGLARNLAYLRSQHLTGGQIELVHDIGGGTVVRSGLCTVSDIDAHAHDRPQQGQVLMLTYDLTVQAGKLDEVEA